MYISREICLLKNMINKLRIPVQALRKGKHHIINVRQTLQYNCCAVVYYANQWQQHQ
uniref:Uncharacterized protein n=1 Tax=Anguilla anguilla TaxID=7936 RepID=A0A0E9V9B3_ANGAN